eukprot:g472.t1
MASLVCYIAAVAVAQDVRIAVTPGATHAGCAQVDPQSFTCADLQSALSRASGSDLGSSSVTVAVAGGVHSAGPYKVAAPHAPGTLSLEGSAGAAIDGGGVRALLAVTGGSLSVKGMRFLRGWVNGTHGVKGAAPVAALASSLVFEDCEFRGNRGFDGGAVLAYHNALSFRRCGFFDNAGYGGGDGGAHDTGGGGAICVVGSHVELLDSTFEDNVATDHPSLRPGTTGTHHGGAVMNIEGHVVARNTSFVRGNAYQGGALYTWMWGTIDIDAGCRFVNNSAAGATHNTGGAIFSDRGSAVIRNSHFEGNIANASGGALFAWSASGSCKNLTDCGVPPAALGGAKCVPHCPCQCQNVTIDSCTFVGNVARKSGGAIGNQWSEFIVKDIRCQSNVPSDIWVDGGASTLNMTNSSTCEAKAKGERAK